MVGCEGIAISLLLSWCACREEMGEKWEVGAEGLLERRQASMPWIFAFGRRLHLEVEKSALEQNEEQRSS